MSAEPPKFDPYYKWLGIPKREQPPSHYRLLGLARFEADPEVIDAAAKRQAAFIQGCGEKKFADVALKVIEQIAAARACLLDPQAKAAYDAELKIEQPKAAARGPRKTRFDALQVSAVDTPLQAASTPAPAPAQAPEEPEDMSLVPLADLEAASQAATQSSAPTPAKSKRAPSAPPQAPLPPVVMQRAGQPESNSGMVIKLAVGGCILAGGITWGLLAWLSSKNEQPQPAPVAAANTAPVPDSPAAAPEPTAPTAPETPPTPANAAAPAPATPDAPAKPAADAPKPAAQAAAPAPAPVAKPAAPAAAKPAAPAPTPAPAAAAPPAAPAPKPPANPLAGTTWRLESASYKSTITFHADGSASVGNNSQRSPIEMRDGMVLGQVGSMGMMLRTVSEKEMAGQINGMAARAFLTTATPAAAAPAAAAKPPRTAAGAATPAPAPAAAPAAPAPAQPGVVNPLRTLKTFREAWVKGPDTTTIDYDAATGLVLEGEEELGGFKLQSHWSEIQMSLHAETITGQLEIQVNGAALKLGTATALIRRPAKVIITFDPANSRVIATIGSRQVARATVMDDNFLSALTCQLRCEGGKTRLKVTELTVKP